MTPRVTVVPAERFGEASAAAFLDVLQAADVPVVALPTGHTPISLYGNVRTAVADGTVNLSRIRPFALDEYVGDPAHPCSNRSYFARYWDVIPGTLPVRQFDPTAANLQADVDRLVAELQRGGWARSRCGRDRIERPPWLQRTRFWQATRPRA